MDVHGGPGARFDDVLAFEAVADSAGHPPEERQTLPCPVVGGMRVLVDSRAPVQRADLRPPGDGLPPSPEHPGESLPALAVISMLPRDRLEAAPAPVTCKLSDVRRTQEGQGPAGPRPPRRRTSYRSATSSRRRPRSRRPGSGR